MQRGRDEIRAKMAEPRMLCSKEIEIQQQRMENAALSLSKSLQSANSSAKETVLDEEKIGMFKAQLRAAEDDLVKALTVKNLKEAKKMEIAHSISASKARIERHKKFVADQRARKDEYADIISHQPEVLKEFEGKYKQDAGRREEIEEAVSWYNKVLGIRIERGREIKFVFTNINMKNPNEEYFFTICLENDSYSLLDCLPHVTEAKKLIQELNISDDFYNFVRTMRVKFQELAAAGNLLEIACQPQETTIISMCAPKSAVSTDNGSESPAKMKGRYVHGVKSSILSPGVASSLH